MTQNSGAQNSTKHHSSQLKLIETISNWRRQEKRDWMGVERGGGVAEGGHRLVREGHGAGREERL